MKQTIKRSGRVIGWVHDEGCENLRCRTFEAAGRTFHATPRFGTLEVNHFTSLAEAESALRAHDVRPAKYQHLTAEDRRELEDGHEFHDIPRDGCPACERRGSPSAWT